ncbi:hypothetical protein MMPV_008770 [Pyropia vietnamensis]
MVRPWKPSMPSAVATVAMLFAAAVALSAPEETADCVGVFNMTSFYPRTIVHVLNEQGREEVPLQEVSFAGSSTPITVRAGWDLLVLMRLDPECASDENSIAGQTTWTATLYLSAAGTSRTLYTDKPWNVSVDGGAYSPALLWPTPVDHRLPSGWAAKWLTHPPITPMNRSVKVWFQYTLPGNVCDGLPTADEVEAANAAASADAAARALAAERSLGGGAGTTGAWAVGPIAAAATLGVVAAVAVAVAAALTATLVAERRSSTSAGMTGEEQGEGDATTTGGE